MSNREGNSNFRIISFRKLEESLQSFNPGFVLYLAGNDILMGDAAGCMSVSEEVK